MAADKVSNPIRVMVVDDLAVIRGLTRRMLEEDGDISVVNTASDGEQAVRALARQPVDVIVLDIEMPIMDGLTAIPKLLAVDKNVKIIMSSTLTQSNAEISLKALAAGATDYVAKPTSTLEVANADEFKRTLVEKVRGLGATRLNKRALTAERTQVVASPREQVAGSKILLRSPGLLKPQIIAIGCSTGGPQALLSLLKDFNRSIDIPILITQHMPPTFTAILAEKIAQTSGWPCAEGKNGEAISRGQIYVAPGGNHMVVGGNEARPLIKLNQEAQENFCRPAVDPMFRSIAAVYGSRVLAVILTGMGSDGLEGGRKIIAAGGTVIAQDQATSVVWGMPGAVATAGICSAVLPLNELAPYMQRVASRIR